MIKLATLLNEEIIPDAKTEGYVIQKNWVGYDAWQDDTGLYENINEALKAYNGWVEALEAYNKDKMILRLVKRTTIVKNEIINNYD